MNKYLYFGFGAVIGSLLTWFCLKSKYEEIAQEEIDSVKETFSKEKEEIKNKTITVFTSSIKPDLRSYAETIVQNDYKKRDIYIISPDEFGAFPDYNQVSLRYLKDGNLIDEKGEILDDADGIVEEDYIDHFGEYELADDAVYLRNDMRCCDYEILKDDRTIEEYLGEV